MPGTDVDKGTGTTIAFGTSSWSSRVTTINHENVSREAFDTTYMGTAAPGANDFGNATFVPSDISDAGEFVIECFLSPQQEPPIDQPAETITLTFPTASGDSTGTIYSFSGFATNLGSGVPHNGLMTHRMTVKVSGAVTITQPT